MTEQEFLTLITTRTARYVLKALAKMSEADRRPFARHALKTQKAYEKVWWEAQMKGQKPLKAFAKDGEALGIAVIATARPSEYACGDWRILPQSLPLGEVFAQLKLSWIDAWAEAAVEDNPRLIDAVHLLNRKRLCSIPQTDAYILGYYAIQAGVPDNARDQFLSQDVWRFFEVEGGGDLSLAAHDKYSGPRAGWADVLRALSENGDLDRQRLLDSSLEALKRDFAQFRAGWYSRFHTALEPSDAEIVERVDQYLGLLNSAVPPTVAFAVKALKRVDKCGELDAKALLDAIEPALQSHQKSTALNALSLLKSCAKRNPDRVAEIAETATSSLISEVGDVQTRAVDLIESLGQMHNAGVQTAMADYLDVVTPTVRARLVDTAPLAEAEITDFPVPRPEPFEPVSSVDEAVSAYLALLEDCHDPFLIEQAFDGIARFGAEAAPLLGPLKKRANQIRTRDLEGGFSPGKYFQRPISVAGLSWANGSDFDAELQPYLEPRYSGHQPLGISPHSFEGIFAARAKELLSFVQAGHSVPMLSAPSDNRGCVDPLRLIDRLEHYRGLGVRPGGMDFRLAILRLGSEGREKALAALNPQTEAERALGYALGGEFRPETDCQLWAMAWQGRRPIEADPNIQRLVGGIIPGLGTPAEYRFTAKIRRIDEYFWPQPNVSILPKMPGDVDPSLGFALPAKFEHCYGSDPGTSWLLGLNPWAVLMNPTQPELYFVAGIFDLELDQKLTRHHCLTYLDSFFRPGLQPGKMAHAMLAWYLASADEGIGMTTGDSIATLIAQGRFQSEEFADAARELVFFGALPLRRWTKRMAQVSELSKMHAHEVQKALSAMLHDLPDTLPRDLGGILELLHELCVLSGSGLTAPKSTAALAAIKAGGKTGKFAKKLLKLHSL
ncbi:DUF6493 family protein [Ruegeria lacuscaerulensis]|uniref:DUF6493 family protein n=1 Tax=Ruegeria lacuscaerulensis TaxID=55218 RepID=UPI0014804777